MLKAYTGRDGRLLINNSEQIKVTSWTLTGNLEALETTTLGDAQRTYVPGVQEFSGSATLLYYSDASGRNDAATLLKNILKVDGVSDTSTVRITLRFVQGNTTNDVALDAWITSVSYGVNVGEVSTAQISFQATGALRAVTI
jgi:hypothetical protein